MEQFVMTFPAACRLAEAHPPRLCGVVSSGNLEVLVESGDPGDACRIEVSTPATGFRDIWAAVLRDFVERQPVGGLRITINDAGATPAVVSLRLDQAMDTFRSEKS
ncbi:MAG: malonate decarboxylase acyl carrier protein [Deltaproteobacteria bacterium]|nr:malonate decarboxylase acyl carrier protein [Deltaproteobacteria bacterium]